MQKRNEPDSTNRIVLADGGSPQFSRRSFFKRAGVAGAAGLVAAGGLTTLASVLTKPALAAADDGGPIETVTGIQGVAESVDPPNNNGYERTLCWTRIEQAASALLPFVDMNAAKAAGFGTSKSYPFEPFTPTLPNPLGDFMSFKGC